MSYQSRQLNLLNKSIDELNELLKPIYKETLDKIYADLIDMYSRIQSEGKPLMSELYRYNRYYKLIKKIQDNLNKLGVEEEKLYNEKLTKLYRDNEAILQEEFPLATKIDTQTIDKILNTDWVGDGKIYSDRIWANKQALAKDIRDNLIKAVITGESSANYTSNLEKHLVEAGYWKARRLTRTEMAHIYLVATVDKYKEAGVSKVKILTANDDRVCETCKSRNNKTFSIDEALNLLPSHPNCRCSIAAIL